MATFAKKTFDTARYAAARPTYPRTLYDLILKYHEGDKRARWNMALDLGCGTGMHSPPHLETFPPPAPSLSPRSPLLIPRLYLIITSHRPSHDRTLPVQARRRHRPQREDAAGRAHPRRVALPLRHGSVPLRAQRRGGSLVLPRQFRRHDRVRYGVLFICGGRPLIIAFFALPHSASGALV